MRLLRSRLSSSEGDGDGILADLADQVAPPELGPPTITRVEFPPSREGVRAKVRFMRGLVDEDRNNPYVRALAAEILRRSGVRPSQPLERARALFEWVRENFTYIHEPVETFTRPRRLLLDARFHWGDCDDFTLALGALFEAAGFETCIEAIGWEGRFRHVFLRVLCGRKWVAAEGTLPMPFGFDPTERAASKHGAGEFIPV